MKKQGKYAADNMERLKYLYIAINIALLITAIYSNAIFLIVCAFCAMFFLPAQFILFSVRHREAEVQEKNCRYAGWLLLLPGTGLIAGSVRMFFFDEARSVLEIAYILVALSAAMIALLIIHIIGIRKEKSVAARFIGYTHFAAMSAPASIAIGVSMGISAAEDASILTGLSGTIFGVLTLVVALSLVLMSLCGFKSIIKSVQTLSEAIRAKKLVFTRISLVKDAFLVIGKAVIGILFLSVFMLMNAFYSLGMGGARFLVLRMHSQNKEEQLRGYRRIGIVILVASVCFALYSLRMFVAGTSMKYSMEVALVIACYTFVEFALNIRDSIRLGRSNDPASEALKLIDLASTLICFVLTQAAIMSFSSKDDPSFANGLSGITFGALSALVGVYMIVRSCFLKKKFSAKISIINDES